MMREHLYKGIPKSYGNGVFFGDIWEDNCEGSFVYGSLIVSKDRYYICVSALCQINSCINNGMTSMIEVIPETVGQYTGLTDKNGNKIFEGDIVKAEIDGGPYDKFVFPVGVTVFENGCFGKKERNNFTPFSSYAPRVSFEVIGNIHDNPELLKEGAE